jgi:hypothetical protein
MPTLKRRRHIRVPNSMPAVVSRRVDELTVTLDGRVTDMSAEGLCMTHEMPVQVGDEVGVELKNTAGERIGMFVEIRWTGQSQTGARIVGMTPRHRSRFVSLLHDAALNQSRDSFAG